MLTPEQWHTLKNDPDFHSDSIDDMKDAEERIEITTDQFREAYSEVARLDGIGSPATWAWRQAWEAQAPQEDVALQLDIPTAA